MSKKQVMSRVAAMAAASKYAEAFRKAYPQKNVVVHPIRNAGGEYEFKVWINGDGGDRRLTWDGLKDATAAFLQ